MKGFQIQSLENLTYAFPSLGVTWDKINVALE